MQGKNGKRNQDVKDQKNPLEWGVFWLGLLLIVSIFAYLGYRAYYYKPASPELYVEYRPDPTVAQPNRYRVAVLNTGGQTAEAVKVELALQQGGKEVEKAEMEIAFVPQESKREGWVNFSQKPPGKDAVSARVVSYQKP